MYLHARIPKTRDYSPLLTTIYMLPDRRKFMSRNDLLTLSAESESIIIPCQTAFNRNLPLPQLLLQCIEHIRMLLRQVS
jgi:hypothetical protein